MSGDIDSALESLFGPGVDIPGIGKMYQMRKHSNDSECRCHVCSLRSQIGDIVRAYSTLWASILSCQMPLRDENAKTGNVIRDIGEGINRLEAGVEEMECIVRRTVDKHLKEDEVNQRDDLTPRIIRDLLLGIHTECQEWLSTKMP